jgi:hypothetical protein
LTFFFLQAQLALMEVQWPDGLYEDTSQHQQQQQQQDKGLRAWSKGRSKRNAGGPVYSAVVWGQPERVHPSQYS